VIAYRYSAIIYWTKLPWVYLIFLKKAIFIFRTAFSYAFLIFCYEISATALAGRFCLARGTRDTKIQVIEVSVSSLYISSLLCNRPSQVSISLPKNKKTRLYLATNAPFSFRFDLAPFVAHVNYFRFLVSSFHWPFFALHLRFHWTRFFCINQFPVFIEFSLQFALPLVLFLFPIENWIMF
jgi:hypothetical protein